MYMLTDTSGDLESYAVADYAERRAERRVWSGRLYGRGGAHRFELGHMSAMHANKPAPNCLRASPPTSRSRHAAADAQTTHRSITGGSRRSSVRKFAAGCRGRRSRGPAPFVMSRVGSKLRVQAVNQSACARPRVPSQHGRGADRMASTRGVSTLPICNRLLTPAVSGWGGGHSHTPVGV